MVWCNRLGWPSLKAQRPKTFAEVGKRRLGTGAENVTTVTVIQNLMEMIGSLNTSIVAEAYDPQISRKPVFCSIRG